MKKEKSKKNKGFVLLFTVVLSSVVFAIALGIANVLYKEIRFGTSAKNTNDAFFAADTGAECALYNDKSTSQSFVQNGSTGTVQCMGTTIAISGAYPVWDFIVSGLGSSGEGCAKVRVNKTFSPNTSLISKGYNNGGSSCIQDSSSVERQLELNY